MTALLEFQRTIAGALMQPLTARWTLSRKNLSRGNPNGKSASDAIALVKPNSRLSSLERLEIYSRSYWSRVLDALGEDFPGVRAVVGAHRFDRLRRAYLADCPSESFTMRNLGRQLPAWMEQHPDFAGPSHDVALDMARLEWAHLESFDAAEYERLTPTEIAALDPGSTLRLQPHLRWIQATSEVDRLLLDVRASLERRGNSTRAVSENAISAHDVSAPAISTPRAFTKARIAGARSAATAANPLYLAIHRHELVVHYKRIDAEMYRLLEALARPVPIGDALEIAYANSALTPEQCRQHVQESFALFATLGWFSKTGPHPSKELP